MRSELVSFGAATLSPLALAVPSALESSGRNSRAMVAAPSLIARKHSFLATACSQARSKLSCGSSASRNAVTTNVSCTASAAAAGSRTTDRQ